jgi:hypothetical protein
MIGFNKMMVEKILKGIAVGLALLMVTLLVLYLNRSDPFGTIPGKRLKGEEVTESIDDWTFANQYRRVNVEVRPSDPYSVNAGYFVHERALYVSSSKSRWAQFMLQEPNVRMRVGDKLYRVRATRMEGAHLEQARQAYSDKYPNRTPEQIAERWFFQITSR